MYRKLEQDPTSRSKIEIDLFLQEAYESETITLEIKKALTNDHLHVPILYLVPKIHKNVERPPRRPIVSGIDSIFQPLTVYIDIYLQDIVGQFPYCLKDTSEFLGENRKHTSGRCDMALHI